MSTWGVKVTIVTPLGERVKDITVQAENRDIALLKAGHQLMTPDDHWHPLEVTRVSTGRYMSPPKEQT